MLKIFTRIDDHWLQSPIDSVQGISTRISQVRLDRPLVDGPVADNRTPPATVGSLEGIPLEFV